jgi:uncharacterized protein
LKIIISDIPEKGLELELSEAIESDASLKILSPVQASLKIDKKDSEVFVRGVADAVIEQQCSRCLKIFSVDLKVNIDTVYRPSKEINIEEHYELKSDEMETGFYKNDEIDLDDLLKEQFMLALPMKPLCSEGCKGLCPQCGADLNISECSCEVSEIDSRLSILKQLLKRKE